MSAIFGFSGWSGKATKKMAAVLGHRGRPPAHVQSSIQSTATFLSSGSGQGGIVEEKGLVLAIAGQLYGEQEIAPLQLLRRYRQQGLSFAKDLRGCFVLAVLDRENIHLARCGSGARTIYYGMHRDAFVFAIEPKGVLAYPGFPRTLRPAAVAQYLSFGFIPGPTTMLADMRELPAGHTVSFKKGKMYNPRCFFFFEQQNKEQRSEQEWIEEFRQMLHQSVTERFPASGSAGLVLTGGLSSSVVGAEVMQLTDKPVASWSIDFGDTKCPDQQFARAVADHLGTDHREVRIQGRDIVQQLKTMAYLLDEPIGDPVVLADSMLAATAGKEVEYLFNGQGGCSLFGSSGYIPMLLQHWYGGIDRDPLFREQAWLASCQQAYSASLLTPEWRSQYDSHKVLEGMLTPFFRTKQPAGFLDKLCAIDIRLNGAHLILPRLEQLAGIQGLTPLSPLFDERLIELSFRMPSTLKLRQGVDRVIMKLAYSNTLPEQVIARSSRRRQIPLHFWFSREIRAFAKEILSPDRLKQAGIFKPEQVKMLLEGNRKAVRPGNALKTWRLLTFELWRRRIIEGEELE